MRKILFALAGLLLTFPVHAADKAGPATIAPAVADASASELRLPFHGLHIGAVLGHASGALRDAEGFQIPRDGYTVGGLIGYDHRLSTLPGVVVGAEADLSVTDVSGSTGPGGFAVHGSSKVLGSVRARLGYSFGNTMLYATGGLGTTNAKINVDGLGSASNNHVKGIVYGAGLESYLIGNIGVRIEWLRFDWRGAGFASDAFDAGKFKGADDQIRAGLVFRL
jgi:outer membrane immunogenic protein